MGRNYLFTFGCEFDRTPMKQTLLLIIIFSFLSPAGEAAELSPQAEISLLTCSSGTEIYSYFGHSAIRIKDPVIHIDSVYNYGIFSFETPHFVWRFCKGETDYMLAAQSMRSFMQEYYEEQRDVYEQVLNFTPLEKQSLYDALIENNKPENRYYRYKHFSDNCATRIRDQFEKALGGRMKYSTKNDTSLTYRQLLDQCLPGNSWSGFGIKLALGVPCDRKTTYSEKMFIPAYLERDMANAVVVRDEGEVPFTKPVTTLYKANPIKEGFDFTSPAMTIVLLFLITLGLSIFEYRRKKRLIWLDFLVFISFGISGLILGFLCFISSLEATGWNLNLIWALPTHFIFAFLLLIKPLREKLSWYLNFTTYSLLLFLISMLLLPQTFHWLVVPICLIMLLRTGGIAYYYQLKARILKTSGHSGY
jgi:hypothetical protein